MGWSAWHASGTGTNVHRKEAPDCVKQKQLSSSGNLLPDKVVTLDPGLFSCGVPTLRTLCAQGIRPLPHDRRPYLSHPESRI